MRENHWQTHCNSTKNADLCQSKADIDQNGPSVTKDIPTRLQNNIDTIEKQNKRKNKHSHT